MRREKEQSRTKMIKGQSRRIARTVEKKANIRRERNCHEYTFSHFQIVEMKFSAANCHIFKLFHCRIV